MKSTGGQTTSEDVARAAGVSIATVDRVVNGRPGVREVTAERVRAAMERLNYRPDPAATRLARRRHYRFCFILPLGTNSFMADLDRQLRVAAEWLVYQRASADIIHVDVFDPQVLADTLAGLDRGYHGVAVVALDHTLVRVAIDDLVRDGVAVVTLVSDLPSSQRLRYVGINNTAAGRTAGSLMGRFLGPRRGSVGIIAGSLSLRDHMERYYGFSQVLGADYPHLELLPVREGRDQMEQSHDQAASLIRDNSDLVGLYSIGGGNRGICAALEEAGKTRDIVLIGHDLTDSTRKHLLSGTFDAIIHQDAGHEARSAARILFGHCSGEPIVAEQERIRIDIFLRDNLP